MKDHFFNQKDRFRIQVFERVIREGLPLNDAAQILNISYRQAKRLLARFKAEGREGILHRLKGKPSNHSFDPETKAAVLELYQERYPDFGPTLAAEKLALDGFIINHETLRLWLIEEELWKRKRRSREHRSRRPRRAHFGELVQMDGSHHHWFEDRAPSCCLMNMIDDATGVTLSFLSEQETIEAAMTLLWKWIETFGIPAALYTDLKNLYFSEEKAVERAELEGVELLTHFGRACKKLDIVMIKAYSPQAKGRVERSNSTYQDRLVKEQRLAAISDIASANELLYGGFLEEINDKFAVEPREEEDYHRKAEGLDLASIFCIEDTRCITKDWIVRFENNYYQLKRQSNYGPARGKVLVRKYLNGELHFEYREQDMAYEKLEEKPERVEKSLKVKKAKGKYKPSPEHPWRKSWK